MWHSDWTWTWKHHSIIKEPEFTLALKNLTNATINGMLLPSIIVFVRSLASSTYPRKSNSKLRKIYSNFNHWENNSNYADESRLK